MWRGLFFGLGLREEIGGYGNGLGVHCAFIMVVMMGAGHEV